MDESALDVYEGVKNNLYRKETITVRLDSGKLLDGMVYILNSKKPDCMPNAYYFDTIIQGYRGII
ncbi:gamma-glutamylcyclotransferase [Clostridium drakei]|uniref:gamma-glutamylcyclotransferase n=1 Tax=Clostridium drakei TaxID=332101 RepID=UPI0039C884EF